ncbi:MAG TPA: hypothetical protein VKZ72_05260 [Acidimicrobiales bacterium]|jgi:hypothetical protein|nr:hypothetical protein [Acidimicrobiales bacterium]
MAKSIMDTVTEVEAKVVEVVRDLREPVVGYVQKGVERVAARLPTVTYPTGLPAPAEIVDSQYRFVSDLLAAEYELVRGVAAAVSPLVGVTPARKATKAAKGAKAAKAA